MFNMKSKRQLALMLSFLMILGVFAPFTYNISAASLQENSPRISVSPLQENPPIDQSKPEGDNSLLVDLEKPPWIIRMAGQIGQWTVMWVLRIAGFSTPDELFFNTPREGAQVGAISGSYWGPFTKEQTPIVVALMGVMSALCIPFLVIILQINLIKVSAARNAERRARVFEDISKFLIVAICLGGLYFFIGCLFDFAELIAQGFLSLATMNGVDVRPEALSLANAGDDIGTMISNTLANMVGGLPMLIALLVFTVYFNFYYGMRLINLFFMTVLSPLAFMSLGSSRFRGIGENFFKEYISSIAIMPINAITWTLGCWIINLAGTGSAFNPWMTIIVYCAIIPQSDILRGVIVGHENSSKMIRGFAGMGLSIASTAALMGKAGMLQGGEGASRASEVAQGAATSGPEKLNPVNEGRTVPFSATTSEATRKVEGYRNLARNAGAAYGTVAGAIGGMVVPGGSMAGAFIGNKIGSSMFGTAGSLMGYAGTALGENNLEPVKDLRQTERELKRANTDLGRTDAQIGDLQESPNLQPQQKAKIESLVNDRENTLLKINNLENMKTQQQEKATQAVGEYWGVDEPIRTQKGEEREAALGIQKTLNRDLAIRQSNKSIEGIYEKAHNSMQKVTQNPEVQLTQGTLLFDEVVGNKMRTYAVRSDGERQFVKEDYHSGKPTRVPQYRVREVIDPADLSATRVHTKTDTSEYTKDELAKMDYNSSGFVDKSIAMSSLRTEINKNIPPVSTKVSGDFTPPPAGSTNRVQAPKEKTVQAQSIAPNTVI